MSHHEHSRQKSQGHDKISFCRGLDIWVVRWKGLEPLAYWFVASHSIQLSYQRKYKIYNSMRPAACQSIRRRNLHEICASLRKVWAGRRARPFDA